MERLDRTPEGKIPKIVCLYKPIANVCFERLQEGGIDNIRKGETRERGLVEIRR